MKMGEKIKVLILINELLRGGAQRIVLDIAKNIDSQKFDLKIVYLKSHANFPADSQTVLQEVLKTGIPVIAIEGKKRFVFGDAWKLYKLVRKEKPDVVQTFLPYAGILGRIVARIAGVRRITSVQCNLPIAYSKRTYWLDKITLSLATVWTGATEGIELSYGGSVQPFSKDAWNTKRKHYTIVAGVDLPVFDATIKAVDRNVKRKEIGLTSEDKVIMMTARLISWKGHVDLVGAMAFISPKAHLVLVGWGPLEAELKKQAQDLGVDNRIHFLGARNDVIALLKTADVYVQAHSRSPDGKIWMGPNTSQMEACAAYVPSVSTAVPLIEYLIEDGKTGTLARPNDPQDLARAINFQIDNPDKTKEMVVNARRRIEERYSIYAMIKKYEELYQNMSVM